MAYSYQGERWHWDFGPRITVAALGDAIDISFGPACGCDQMRTLVQIDIAWERPDFEGGCMWEFGMERVICAYILSKRKAVRANRNGINLNKEAASIVDTG